MSKVTELFQEGLELIAKKEGKPSSEVMQQYSKKYGPGAVGKILEDSSALRKSDDLTKIVSEQVPSPEPAKNVEEAPKDWLKDALGTNPLTSATKQGNLSGLEPAAKMETKSTALPSAKASPAPSGSSAQDEFGALSAEESSLVKGAKEAQKKKSTAATAAKLAGVVTAASAGGYALLGSGEVKPAAEGAAAPSRVEETKKASAAIKDPKISSAVAGAGRAKTPQDFLSVLKSMETPAKELPEADRKAYEAKLGEINDSIKLAQEEYKQNRDRAQWGEVAEKLGFALAQIGAGMEGRRTGVDVSGIKFNPANWQAKYDLMLAELKQATGEARKDQEFAQGELRNKEEKIEKENARGERKTEKAQKYFMDDYLQTKADAARSRENALDRQARLDEAKIKGDRETADLLEKQASAEVKALQDRLAKLREVKADMISTKDSNLTSEQAQAATKNFRDSLMKLGENGLLAGIDAAEDKWFSGGFAGEAAQKLIDEKIKETEEQLNLVASGRRAATKNKESKAGLAPGSVVTFRYKPSGQIGEVKSEAADKYLNNPDYEVVSGGSR